MASATPLSSRPLVRSVTLPDGTPVVLRLTDRLVEMRIKRTRTWYPLPWGHAFLQAARMVADAKRRAPKRTHRNLLKL
jgi:hypothetical protein